jgi:dTDP-glucose 4,6-dehydratase
MSRVVITGGAGFLGSHLCRAFLARGDDVVAVDNLTTGRLQNVVDLESEPGFELVVADVCRAIPVAGAIDGVLHFASPASPPEYLEMPLETLDVGSLGTRQALDLARAHGARFLVASTSEIYGDPHVHPQREDYNGNVDPTGPRAVYDEAKRFAETLTMTYRRLYDLDTAIVRIFNTYGPRLRPADGRVVSNFLAQAIDGKALTIYGDGAQTRSFCYVDDEVRGIVALFDSHVADPVNIGNPDEYTMLELADIVREVTGSSSELTFEPLPTGDPVQRRPDITRARKLLGWEPTVSLREGLTRMHEWYLEERARGRA